MEPIFICAIIFFAVYKIFELFTRRKERLNLIEKLGSLDLTKECNLDLSKILGTSSNKYTSLRGACVLVGIGLGFLVSLLIGNFIPMEESGDISINMHNMYEMIQILRLSTVLLFGGLGFLVSYLIEKRGK